MYFDSLFFPCQQCPLHIEMPRNLTLLNSAIAEVGDVTGRCQKPSDLIGALPETENLLSSNWMVVCREYASDSMFGNWRMHTMIDGVNSPEKRDTWWS